MGKRISFTLSANRLTFSNRSGGAFSIPVRTETTPDDETTHARHDEQRQRMTFAEWCDAVDERRQKDAAAAQRFVRCGSCNVLMPEPENPVGSGRCLFDTCEACLAKRETDAKSER